MPSQWAVLSVTRTKAVAQDINLNSWFVPCRSSKAQSGKSGLTSRYVKCLFTDITYAHSPPAHNSSRLTFLTKMMMANGSTTSIPTAISNLLIVTGWFVNWVGNTHRQKYWEGWSYKGCKWKISVNIFSDFDGQFRM